MMTCRFCNLYMMFICFCRSLGIIEAVRITPPPKTKDARKQDTSVSITVLNIGSTQTMFQVNVSEISLNLKKTSFLHACEKLHEFT